MSTTRGPTPFHGSGKTHFNRIKRKGNKDEQGESWTELRDAHIKAGKWKRRRDQKTEMAELID